MSLLSIFEMEWKQHFLDNLPTKTIYQLSKKLARMKSDEP
jgi:hypothetical protein